MAILEVGPHTTADGQRRISNNSWIMWASDGLVIIQDRKDGTVKVLSCREAFCQLKNFQRAAEIVDKNSHSSGSPGRQALMVEQVRQLRQMVSVLQATYEDAIRQGDQNNQEIRRKKHEEFSRRKAAGTDGQLNAQGVMKALFDPDKEPLALPEAPLAGDYAGPLGLAPPTSDKPTSVRSRDWILGKVGQRPKN